MISAQVLKEFRLFKGFNDSELVKVVEICHEKTIGTGKVLFKQGNKASKLHLCRSGIVDIVVWLNQPHGIEVTVHKVKPGEVLGWSSLVEPYIYTASAKCSEKADIIYTDASDLIELFRKDSHIGYIFMKNLSTVISSRLAEYRHKFGVELALSINQEW